MAASLPTEPTRPASARTGTTGSFATSWCDDSALERSEGEVAALHIHAASFFETSALWPEAIHHYLEAGLQPQAARLIAKYGEELVSSGRLPLVETWLSELPPRTVKDNARLSLLAGELAGVRGDWKAALASLTRSRAFFTRKGDRRMEAVACSKLSTVYTNLGDVSRCAAMAHEGLALAPADAYATKIRLRGNVAVTSTWLESPQTALLECRHLAEESTSRGYEQFAAIAHHNLGVLLRDAGRLEESLASLTKAEAYWDVSPTNPFATHRSLFLLSSHLAKQIARPPSQKVPSNERGRGSNRTARLNSVSPPS